MIPVPFLNNRTVAMMGLGKSGMATCAALQQAGATVWAWDDNPAARQAAEQQGLSLTDLHQADIAKADVVVWSPGIPHSYPLDKASPVAAQARQAGKTLVCDVDLLAQAKPETRMLGITGTNGKSTTTTLLAHVLKVAGRTVAAGGNLGTAALDMPDLPDTADGGRYVLELSSYQLELVPHLTLFAGVMLNITPDHLGRHGGLEGYIAAKRRLFECVSADGVCVIGVDDEPSAQMAADLKAAGRTVVEISVQRVLAQGVSAPDGLLRDNGQIVGDLRDCARLPGSHNWQNACAVYALARADGVDVNTILTALASYPGLAHRQELIVCRNGVTFINDSKATNADATAKALVCYPAIHWIVGGQAKEGGIIDLEPLFSRIIHAYIIGEATEDFARTLEGKVAYTRCGTLDKAVAAAVAAARDGDVVLLSPACASWDQFKSFEHRGDVFRALVLGEAAPC